MARNRLAGLCLLLLAGWLGSAPESPEAQAPMAQPMMITPLAEYVAPDDSLSRLRMLDDGLVTLNDRCPVRQTRLNRKMGASYVNGRPVGFC
jgi:hypothetical protein